MKKNDMFNKSIDAVIKPALQDHLDTIEAEASFIERVISASKETNPYTPLQRFLEMEIRIPISMAVVSCVVVLGIFANSLLLPKELPSPSYEILNMSSQITMEYNRGDLGNDIYKNKG